MSLCAELNVLGGAKGVGRFVGVVSLIGAQIAQLRVYFCTKKKIPCEPRHKPCRPSAQPLLRRVPDEPHAEADIPEAQEGHALLRRFLLASGLRLDPGRTSLAIFGSEDQRLIH